MIWAILIPTFLFFDLLLVAIILFGALRMAWSPLVKQFPFVDPAADAVRRDFQSFRIGVMNLGYSVHVAADDNYLHMFPARVLRWCGAKPMSIPWNEITIEKRSRTGQWVIARIAGRQVAGPAWCLNLAQPSD